MRERRLAAGWRFLSSAGGDNCGNHVKILPLNPAKVRADANPTGGRARRGGKFLERNAQEKRAAERSGAGLQEQANRRGAAACGVEQFVRLSVEMAGCQIPEIIFGEPGIERILRREFQKPRVGPQ